MNDAMSDPWAHARAVFAQQFQPLVDAGYQLERLDSAEVYWRRHDATLAGDFPPEVFFDLRATRTAEASAAQARVVAARADRPLTDFTVVHRDGAVVAMFSGEQREPGVYRMWHTNVARGHRRRGLYRRIVECSIGYTGALGFDAITSEHAPSNNAVIIAKLRAGFCVYGLELDPSAGVSLVLRYFHLPAARAAYEYRCGLASVTPELAAVGFGAFATLREQLGAPR